MLVTVSPMLRVAVSAPNGIDVWQIDDGKPTQSTHFDVEHEAYAILFGDEALALVRASPPSDECGETKLSVLRRGGAWSFETPTPPETLLVRPISSGFFVAWIGPRSCALASHPMAYGLLLDRTGRARGAPMAMADATGFSLSSHGDTVDLFMSTRQGIVWAAAECAAKK
jgi:hypothetical protein